MKKQKELGFHFQEIPLQEAQSLAMAGYGNYADIKAVLLEKLPALPPLKAFAFGLPNGREVDEKARRAICSTTNQTLKKASIAWRVTYSSKKKIFVCIPRAKGRNSPYISNGVRAEDAKRKRKDISELRDKNMTFKQISNHLGIPLNTITSIYYGKKENQKLAKNGGH